MNSKDHNIVGTSNRCSGGQSLPNFDYAMAPGVLKTFRKEFAKMLNIGYEDLIGEYHAEPEDTEMLIDAAKAVTTIKVVPSDMADRLYKELKAAVDGDSFLYMVAKAYDRAYAATEKATYQAMEALIHNLNTMNSRAGAQVPFSSVNFGTDTTPEGRMVIKNFLLATEAGLGNGETPIFPVSIFKVKEGVSFNEDDPNYDLFKLAVRCSAKRLFPNFSFLDAPFNLPFYKEGDYNSEVAYMGCRTRVMANSHDPSKAVVCGRGNLSFTSINLPRIGIESNRDFTVFYEKLDAMLELVAKQLLHRFKIQCSKKGRNYPFLMGQGIWIDSDDLGPDDSVAEILKHGTLSIGFIGLAETMKALTGKHHGEDEEVRKKAFEVVKHMRAFCDKKSAETGLNFTLLATPEQLRVA